jgi:hypothetical protein
MNHQIHSQVGIRTFLAALFVSMSLLFPVASYANPDVPPPQSGGSGPAPDGCALACDDELRDYWSCVENSNRNPDCGYTEDCSVIWSIYLGCVYAYELGCPE